jgi:two-component system sensor histidine kinase/response regulator
MSIDPGRVQLDDLLAVCRAGDHINRELLKEMLALFIEDNRRRVDLAIAAADSGDRLELRSAVHAIKGSAALVGAAHLRDLASDIELRVVQGNVDNVAASTQSLRTEFDAVAATLRSLYPDLPEV